MKVKVPYGNCESECESEPANWLATEFDDPNQSRFNPSFQLDESRLRCLHHCLRPHLPH